MTRLAPLVAAVTAAQADDPLKNPVTVLCMPGARDDIILALAKEKAHANVQVLTLQMLVDSQFPDQLKGAELASLVTHELQNLPDSSLIKQKGLASEPATRVGVRAAVESLIHSPRELWEHTGPRTLPAEIRNIAVRIAERTNRVLPYQAWDQTVAPTNTIVWDVVGLNPAEDRLLERLPKGLRASTSAVQTRYELADEHTQALAVLSKVREHLATTELHRIGVALLRPEFGPLLIDAAEDLPLLLRDNLTKLEEPVAATLLALLSIDIDDMPRTELATALQRGCITWKDSKGERPTIHGFDRASRKKNSPRKWPEWTTLEEETERQWIEALRTDLTQVRNAQSWSTFADRAESLARNHLREPIPSWIFEGLYAYDELGIEFSYASALEASWEAAASAYLAEKPKKGLRVGPLSSFAGCDLDVVIVCNASAACLPAAVTEQPGVSWDQLGTDVAAETRRQEVVFEATLRAANSVVFLHPHQLSGGEFGGVPSLWTTHATLQAGSESSDFPLSNRRQVDFHAAINGKVPEIALQANNVLTHRKVGSPASEFNGFIGNYTSWLSGHAFSASALNTYIKSPYLFFAKYVAGMWELEADPADDLEKKDQGTIVHAILEDWTNSVWLKASPRPRSFEEVDWDNAYALLLELVEKHLAEDLPPTISALAKLSFESLVRRNLDVWFAEEKQRAAEGWVPVGAEIEFGEKTDTRKFINDGSDHVFLTGKIDRLEYHPASGQVRVVDFKTGRNKLKKEKTLTWDDPDTFTLQPYFYGFAMRSAIRSGWLQKLLSDAGLDDSNLQPEIAIHFYFIFNESERERHFKESYNDTQEGIFSLFIEQLCAMLASGMFYPREIEPGMWGYQYNVVRLGSNNYARQATAVKDHLFTYFQQLAAQEENDND